MKILFSIIGAFFGALVGEEEGLAYGFFIGLLAGTLIQFRRRILDLEDKVRLLQSGLVDSKSEITSGIQAAPAVKAPPPPSPVTPPAEMEEPDEITLMPLAPPSALSTLEPEPVTAGDAGWGDTSAAPSSGIPSSLDPIFTFIRNFFTTGNVVVKVGMIILFFGVAFLLKYAAERNMFPIELRLVAVAAFGIGMLVIGWRLRISKTNFALVVQGGAVGVLYLTLFSAAKLYHVIPLGLTFGLMFGLVMFSCVLAVIQNSMALAIFAASGGFLAPILMSTGEGNHVALFSYYALLNAGIFGIAWYKSWRPLNWIGFVFTFVIASLWGYRSYQPEYFNTTEPFLILFFIFYVSISILFAHRQPPQLKGFVDSSLVFGTPLVGFALQSQLIEDIEFGRAYSALVLSAVYIVLAKVLWKKQAEGMRMLTEAFLALGVIFASLAVPLALDGRWTSAAWALEGAGMAWVGIRQNRLLPRMFGLLLQIGAAIAFISTIDHPHSGHAIFNSAYIGSVMISISALFIGLQIYRHRDHLHAAERDAHIVLLIWGLIWWFAAAWVEIEHHVLRQYELNTFLFFTALSFWFLFVSARKLRWPASEQPPVLLLPAMILIAFIKFVDTPLVNPFMNLGYVAWITAFAVQYALLYRAENTWRRNLLEIWHATTMWLYLFVATWVIANAVSRYVPGMRSWNDLFWGLIPALGIYKLLYMRKRITWPLQQFEQSYLSLGIFPVAAYLAVWIVVKCFNEGNPDPLPWFPIMNPQDIVQLFAMLSLFDWLMDWRKKEIPGVGSLDPDKLLVLLGGIGFIWLNALVAHCVHFYGGVGYDVQPMFNSEIFQSSISIVWTLSAFTLMGVATRKGWRRLWFAGAVLLGAVVVKLFIVDLADIGTVARIVSFLSVGILMLIIGYVTPLPPRQAAE